MKKRSSIVLDETIVQAAFKATGLKTRKELVVFALRDLLRRESQKKILEMKGKVHWEDDLAKMRRSRFPQ